MKCPHCLVSFHEQIHSCDLAEDKTSHWSVSVEKREENAEKYQQKQLWLYDQIKEMKKLLEPYLGYKHIRS